MNDSRFCASAGPEDASTHGSNKTSATPPCSLALPKHALAVIEALEDGGHEAWCVGGFVRDSLLGRPTNDVDIATSASWSDVARTCESRGMRVHETGTKHGTVTVCPCPDDHVGIEVTTYRVDGAYTDGRHPDSVRFVTSIEEDLARRDFTINALAYHPTCGLLDPFGGIADLQDGIIRTVGDPARRFSEDALRILRGCRFRSQLGLSIKADTYQAMMERKHLLYKVSAERVEAELTKFIMGEFVHDALMETVDVISFVLPELVAMKGCAQDTKYHIYDVLEHTAYVVQNAPQEKLVRWAALFHDMGKPAAGFHTPDGVGHFYRHANISAMLAKSIMTRLKMSSRFEEDALALVLRHDDVIAHTPKSIHKAVAKLGRPELFPALCHLKAADAYAQAPFCRPRADEAAALLRLFETMQQDNAPFSVRNLAISGHDIIELGIEQGPAVGRILDELLARVFEQEVDNKRDALIELAQRLIDKEQGLRV